MWKEFKSGVSSLLSKIGEWIKSLFTKKQPTNPVIQAESDAIRTVAIPRSTLTVLADQMMGKQVAAAKVAAEAAQKKEAQLKEVSQPIAQLYEQQATKELF